MKYPLSTAILETFPALANPIYGLPAWYWVSICVALLVSTIVAGFLRSPLSYSLAFLFRQKDKSDRFLFVQNLKGAIGVLLTLVLFLIMSAFIKDPETDRATLSVAFRIAVFLSCTYLGYRLIDLAFSRLIKKNVGGRHRIALILPLGRRVAKTLLIICAVLLLLSQFGVDVSAFLVGLGVGGLAIALAAQKILENLFGGAVLSLDQPFQVGDYCRCGDLLGFIEEIGVRSTRIRTLDRTLITIPNSQLSEMKIENFAEREKIRLYQIIRIDLSTSLVVLKEILSEFERILHEDENFLQDFYRIRLIGMSELGFEIELFVYANTSEQNVFFAMREQLLFAYLEKIEELGGKLALPGRRNFLYQSALK